jgi:hypothetical protein
MMVAMLKPLGIEKGKPFQLLLDALTKGFRGG